MFRQTISTYPPKPPLALHIGVTGHRPEGLNAADMPLLCERITTVIQEIDFAYRQFATSDEARAVFSHEEPLPPRLLSPLAEGTDRIAAETALQHGYVLHCPLPFPREVYAEDFKHDKTSQAAFESLLARAERVLELDGERDKKDRAYRNVGHFVLRHADILLAVWNGEENDMSPGTAGIVAAAIHQKLPVLWIHTIAPHTVQVYDPNAKNGIWQPLDSTKLAALLRTRLLPFDILVSEQQMAEQHAEGLLQKWVQHYSSKKNCRHAYFTHAAPRRNLLGIVYRTLFTWLGKRRFSGIIGNAYRQDAEFQWQMLVQTAKSALQIEAMTRAHFIHADSLASYYADQYRGTFILSFTLGSIAVLFALLGAPFKESNYDSILYTVLELAAIVTIACLIASGKFQALHQRWLDFRLVAERLRQRAFLAPIGSVSEWSLPVFHSHGDHSLAWVNWLVRSIYRSEGIPHGSFDADYRTAYHSYLLTVIEEQAYYHRLNAKRNEKIAHALHLINSILLLVIVTACLLHIFWHAPIIANLSTIIAATLPAFGAAVAGVLSQGEFKRIAHRSQGMAEHLQAIAANLKQIPEASALELARQAQQAIEIMSQELFDWRVIFRAKPLELHA